MVDGVDEGFLDRRQRVIEEPAGLGSVRVLDDLFADNIVLDIAQGVADLVVNRPAKRLLNDLFCPMIT